MPSRAARDWRLQPAGNSSHGLGSHGHVLPRGLTSAPPSAGPPRFPGHAGGAGRCCPAPDALLLPRRSSCVRACPATPARVFHRQCVASPQTPPRAGAGQPGSLRRQATSVCTSFPTSTPVAEDYSDFKLASRSFGSTREMKDSRTHGHHSKVLEGASRAEGHATLHEKGQSLTLVRRVGGDQSSPSDVRSEGGAGRRS